MSHGKFWSVWEHVRPDLYATLQLKLFSENDLIDGWMRGQYDSETVCERLTSDLRVPAREVFDALILGCRKMVLDRGLVEQLGELSGACKIVLVTDNMDCFTRFTVPAQNLSKHFHDILNSCDLGRLKKDDGGRTFKEYLKKEGLDFSQSLLIDDSESACELFSALGGRSIKSRGVDHTISVLGLLCDQDTFNADQGQLFSSKFQDRL
ncbi:MAG: hypothetical protein ABIJ35_00980, partial [Acidobacteriota bacterium]